MLWPIDLNQQSPLPQTYWRVEPREGQDGFRDINFIVEAVGPPSEQLHLKSEIEAALRVLRVIYPDEGSRRKFDEAYDQLLALSQVGLVGVKASPATATLALRTLEQDIVAREAGPIKNTYMKRLGFVALISAGVGFVVYAWAPFIDRIPTANMTPFRNAGLVWIGAMAGAWSSFATRKVVISFADLSLLEEDRLEPSLRLIFTGLLTLMLALMFRTGLVDVRIGAFAASAFLQSGTIALLVGAFAGLSEKALPTAIASRATAILATESK